MKGESGGKPWLAIGGAATARQQHASCMRVSFPTSVCSVVRCLLLYGPCAWGERRPPFEPCFIYVGRHESVVCEGREGSRRPTDGTLAWIASIPSPVSSRLLSARCGYFSLQLPFSAFPFLPLFFRKSSPNPYCFFGILFETPLIALLRVTSYKIKIIHLIEYLNKIPTHHRLSSHRIIVPTATSFISVS